MKTYTIKKKIKIPSLENHLLAEGPIWDYRFERYFFVDIKKNYFYMIRNNSLKKYKLIKKVTSIILTNKENNIIIITFNSIIMYDLKKKKIIKTLHKSNFINERFNDSFILSDEKILISSMDNSEKKKIGKLYLFNRFKKKKVLLKDFIIGNGIDYCNLKKKFYFSISDMGLLVSFELKKNKIINKKYFCKIPKKYGVPDGITIDREGLVWVSCYGGGHILRFNQKGKVNSLIKVPSKFPTSLCFGGKNFRDILITSAMDNKIKKYGKIYIYNSKFTGKKINYLKLNY